MARKIADAVDGFLSVESQVEIARLKSQVASLRSQYKSAIAAVSAERDRADSLASLAGIKPRRSTRASSRKSPSDATAIVLLSDWHVEERVPSESVMGKNFFTLDVADRRIAELSDRMETLITHERHLAKIDRIVIAAIGDFISNMIHEDQAEMAQLPPLAATRWAGERLRGIIDRAAGLADEVIVVTAVGNHGRTTPKQRMGATEQEMSYEQNLYEMMAAYEPNDNVTWQIGRGYLNVVDLDGFKVAFHHGHAISGNIHIGATKAIAQWQRSNPVDFHCFGHHHQFSYCRGKYMSNGSLIGYNAYALRCRCEYEPPCQSLAVVCHRRNEVTRAIPIFCDRDLQEKDRCQRKASSRTSKRRTSPSGRSSRRETKSGTVVRIR